MRKEELRDCPFCGANFETEAGLKYHPNNECILEGRNITRREIDAWNRRPIEDALRERVGVLEKALNTISTRECEDYGGSGWNCVEFFRSIAKAALTPPETTGEAAK